jgi:hypothetical protein
VTANKMIERMMESTAAAARREGGEHAFGI